MTKEGNEQRIPRAAAALGYNPARDNAPRVVVAGRGILAQRIEETAREAGVPVYRDEQLAWTLTALGLDREIPAELYEVVATVIAWVYLLEQDARNRTQGKG
ncbi:MAG: EscU/YscU/HrcU family type III secretion system export apparatus switch protein [Bacillota bacterium]|uniref:EscU/YscU/HrcU family type III secretion system export apparatus switch protein n=1 Tax=Desulforudis sp. DRI-14 TaxID=3459793 RepID=UPI00346B3473